MTIEKATIMLIILVQIIQEVMLWLNISAAHDIAREVLSLECRVRDMQDMLVDRLPGKEKGK